jgi:hypothetical protein
MCLEREHSQHKIHEYPMKNHHVASEGNNVLVLGRKARLAARLPA